MKLKHIVYLISIWLVFLTFQQNPSDLIAHYWHFFVVGITGAVVANSTGAGGGIVFIPFFSTLDLSATQTLATSILIQSFGMTAGAISWLTPSEKTKLFSKKSRLLLSSVLLICAPGTITGILVAQHILAAPPFQMLGIFKIFSVLFGAGLLFITLFKTADSHIKQTINYTDKVLLAALSFAGGMITAWISIGIGEIVVLYLIIRRYPVMLAISCGVCISSIAVLTAAPYHIAMQNPAWKIVIFAAPAAIIGGTIAKFFAAKLGPVRLKVFFATWILATGLSM